MKKSPIIILCAALIALSGCSLIVDGEYKSSEPHSISSYPTAAETSIIEVSSKAELDEALVKLVTDHKSYGRLRFSSYSGNVSADLADACVNLTASLPLASYAVYYVNYSLDLIVSYYEADISITYKKTADECAQIEAISGEDIGSRIEAALLARTVAFTFYCDEPDFGAAALNAEIDRVYFSGTELLYRPEGELLSYPPGAESRICEVVFTYPYSLQETRARRKQIDSAIDGLIEGVEELEGAELISVLSLRLAEFAEYDIEKEETGEYSPWAQAYTAYGALVQKKAAGEGFAIAMKLILERLGLDCVVVRGEKDGVPHSWNIVFPEEGAARHLDVSLIPDAAEEVVFRTDAEMKELASWSGDYPVCEEAPEAPEETDSY